MNKIYKKLCVTAVALTACLTAPVALAACGGNTDGGKTDGDGDGDKCTVTFDAGNGTIFGNRLYKTEVEKNSVLQKPSEDPTYQGYCFIGWNATGDRRDVMWNFLSDTVTENIILQAVWAREFTVTFDADGGTFANGTDTYTIKTADGEKLTAPQVTAPDGRVLIGWNDYYNQQWNFDSDTVNGDVKLTASYDLTPEIKTALEPFTYRISGNGFTVTGVNDKSVTALNIPSVVNAIDDRAFMDCGELISVNIPDSVTQIGESAFSNCANLKSVSLPVSLTRIEDSLFYGCAKLETIDIPDTIVYVGAGAFDGCAALKSIELPTAVTEIPNYLFRNCASLENVIAKSKITKIDAYAFYGCAALDDFDISSATEISSDAFNGCASLTELNITSLCDEIGYNAFKDCTGLISVSINSRVVGSNSFAGCSALKSVFLGANIVEIENGAFRKCSALTEINIPDTVTTLDAAFSGCLSLAAAEIGNGVTKIAGNTFSDCIALKSVEFKGEVTEIGMSAFSGCFSLTSFDLPSSMAEVRGRAFEDCDRLKEVIKHNSKTIISSTALPSGCKVISSREESQFKTVDNYVFYPTNNTATPYTLLDYVGDSATLTLPQDCDGQAYSIHDYALACNPDLKSVTFPSNIQKIGSLVIYGSNNIETLAVASGNTKYMSHGNCIISIGDKTYGGRNQLIMGCKTSVIPTDGAIVDYIAGNAFSGNTELKNLTIPTNIIEIASNAFDGCINLFRDENNIRYVDKWAIGCSIKSNEPVTIRFAEDTVGIAGDFVGLYSNDKDYSMMARKIGAVVTNANLKYISRQAFYDCYNLISVTLNDGLLYISGSAFGSCTKLTEITIPDSVENIGGSAFGRCTSLAYVKLPNGITTIEYQMFDGCTQLKEVVIPSSVTKIEHDAFRNTALTAVYYCGDATAWNSITTQNGNDALNVASRIKYYSETSQSGCWHYDEDGKPALWA